MSGPSSTNGYVRASKRARTDTHISLFAGRISIIGNTSRKIPERSPISLRHTFIKNLKDRGVPEPLVAEIVGLAVEDMTYGRYGKGYELETKLEAIKKVDYGIDLRRVKFPL